MNLKKIFSKKGLTLKYTLSTLGNDIILLVGGGKEHIGSVVLAVPRPSLANPEKISSTISLLNVVGHKDDEIARPLAEALCIASNRSVVVIVGIHYDNLNSEDIKIIQILNEQAKEKIKDWIKELGKKGTYK